jgi:hypothetical protein
MGWEVFILLSITLIAGMKISTLQYIYLDPGCVPFFSLDWLVADCNTLGGGKKCLLKVNTSYGLA